MKCTGLVKGDFVDHRKAARRLRIEKAADEVLVERGFAGASMLAIAKRTKASVLYLDVWKFGSA